MPASLQAKQCSVGYRRWHWMQKCVQRSTVVCNCLYLRHRKKLCVYIQHLLVFFRTEYSWQGWTFRNKTKKQNHVTRLCKFSFATFLSTPCSNWPSAIHSSPHHREQVASQLIYSILWLQQFLLHFFPFPTLIGNLQLLHTHLRPWHHTQHWLVAVYQYNTRRVIRRLPDSFAMLLAACTTGL
jgi:hypothetical protein